MIAPLFGKIPVMVQRKNIIIVKTSSIPKTINRFVTMTLVYSFYLFVH